MKCILEMNVEFVEEWIVEEGFLSEQCTSNLDRKLIEYTNYGRIIPLENYLIQSNS